MKTLQWTGTMALVASLGIFDIVLVCPLFRKKRGAGDDADDPGSGDAPSENGEETGFSLLG